jgi:hypothetical protein
VGAYMPEAYATKPRTSPWGTGIVPT